MRPAAPAPRSHAQSPSMLHSPRSPLHRPPSFAAATPAARAELSVLTLLDSDSDSEVSRGLQGRRRTAGLRAPYLPPGAQDGLAAGGSYAVPTLRLGLCLVPWGATAFRRQPQLHISSTRRLRVLPPVGAAAWMTQVAPRPLPAAA